MNQIKISVATVTYNCKGCIEESVLSVINQTYNNVEYIIIDGGSTDGTVELLKKYGRNINVLVSEKDNGIYDAMNKALNVATGDFIIFLGADDHFLSWKTLEKVVEKMTELNVVYYGQVFFEGYNLLHKGKFNKYKRAVFNYCHQCIFYPKVVYKNYTYNQKYRLYSDNEYNFRISEKYEFKYIDETVAFFASGGESGKRNDVEWDKIKNKMILSHCGILPYIYMTLRKLIKE